MGHTHDQSAIFRRYLYILSGQEKSSGLQSPSTDCGLQERRVQEQKYEDIYLLSLYTIGLQNEARDDNTFMNDHSELNFQATENQPGLPPSGATRTSCPGSSRHAIASRQESPNNVPVRWTLNMKPVKSHRLWMRPVTRTRYPRHHE